MTLKNRLANRHILGAITLKQRELIRKHAQWEQLKEGCYIQSATGLRCQKVAENLYELIYPNGDKIELDKEKAALTCGRVEILELV